MANEIALDTADRVEIVRGVHAEQWTAIAAEAIEAGAPVRMNGTDGKFTNANGSSTTEDQVYGIALKSVAAGEPVTALRRGALDGFDLSGLNYGAPIYLSDTDGRISGTTGTKGVRVGFVAPGNAQLLGSSPDKVLYLDPTDSAAIS